MISIVTLPSDEMAVLCNGALLRAGADPRAAQVLADANRGGNIALLVEILATLSGASFSTAAAPFDRGTTSPGIGVFLLGIDPANFTGSIKRLVHRLESLFDDFGVRLPAAEIAEFPNRLQINADALRRLQEATGAA